MHQPLRFALALFALLAAVVSLPAGAGTVIENNDWYQGEEAAKALEVAKERNLPVVLLVTMRETTCPLCVNAAQDIFSARPHRDMVRIMYYLNAAELNHESVAGFAQEAGRKVGTLSTFSAYYLTAEGDPLGFVPYGKTTESSAEGGTVLQIHQWINSVAGDIVRADREARDGRYDRAMERIETIQRRDAQVSHLIQQLLGKAEQDAPMPDTPVSLMFPDLYDTKLAEYQALAQEELDAAKALVAEDKLREAQRALRPLSRGPEAFDTTAQAKALLEEVEQKMRDSRE